MSPLIFTICNPSPVMAYVSMTQFEFNVMLAPVGPSALLITEGSSLIYLNQGPIFCNIHHFLHPYKLLDHEFGLLSPFSLIQTLTSLLILIPTVQLPLKMSYTNKTNIKLGIKMSYTYTYKSMPPMQHFKHLSSSTEIIYADMYC